MSANPAEPIRVVYFGTPAYAVPALEALLTEPRVSVELVVTQPDRPAGRGRRLTPPPVADVANAKGITVYQPETLRTERDRAVIAQTVPDLFVVAAFGKIFGPRLLAIPRLGSVNLHASLLPSYRGASPVSAAILEGKRETGVTLMRMDTGLDTGPTLAVRAMSIASNETTASLTPRLAELGAQVLIDSLPALIDDSIRAVPQDEKQATLTRPLVKADGWIDWSRPAVEIERQIRAMWEWPRAWTTLNGEPVQIHRATVQEGPVEAAPGTVGPGPSVATGAGSLKIEAAQRPGSKPLPGPAWLQQSDALGAILGAGNHPETHQLPMIRPARG